MMGESFTGEEIADLSSRQCVCPVHLQGRVEVTDRVATGGYDPAPRMSI